MKQFPLLYSRTSTGAIQTWQVVQDGNEYWTISGQIDGAKTESKPTICAGKNIGRANETSPAAQALSEAESAWKKKRKTGYFEDINEIDNMGYVEPMLAKKYIERLDKIVYPVGVQLKYNGLRCVATAKGLFSRKGEEYLSVPHISDSLKAFFAENPDAVLDGELFNEDYRQQLNEIVKLVRKSVNATPKDLEKSEQLICYYVYDGYGFGGVAQASFYRERATAIKTALSTNPYYRHVPTTVAHTEADVIRIYNSYVAQGHEGAIVRTLDSPYENKRSSNLLKVKPTDDDEFPIIAVEEGVGNRAGTAGKVVCKMKDGRMFKANIKGTFAQAKDILDNPQNYIGKEATIFYNGFTGKLTEIVDGVEKTFATGKPNFAQFDCNNFLKGDR